MRREFKIALLAWVVAAAALFPPLVYSVYAVVHEKNNWLWSSYLQALMSSWAATVLGIGVGLPVALWLNRLAQREADKAENEKTLAAAKLREDRVLQIVEQELTGNLGYIEAVINNNSLRFHFDVARWQAIGSSGDAAAIDDLAVLQRVARTYEQIETLNAIAGQWLVVMTNHHVADGSSVLRDETLRSLVVASSNDALRAINETLPVITQRQTQLRQR